MIRDDLENPIVVIGAGMAGLSFIRDFRKLSNKEIILIDQSEKKVYSKPQLSNFFKNKKTINELVQLDIEDFCLQNNCKFIVGRVDHIIPEKKLILFQNKQEIIYENLILATGGSAINPFNNLKNVYSYNSLDDLSKFSKQLSNKKKVCILGSGIVAVELANDLIMSGLNLDVSILTRSKNLLEYRIPEEAALSLQESLIQNNVIVHLNADLKNISNAQDQVLIQTDAINELYDLVIVAYGIKVDFSICAELSKEKGIRTNLYLQTNLDCIFAIGDCVQIERLYMPFVAPMLSQSKALAMTIAGTPTKVHLMPNPLNIKTPLCPISVFGPYDHNFYWEKLSDVSWISKNKNGDLVGACLIQQAARDLRIEMQEKLIPFFIKEIGT